MNAFVTTQIAPLAANAGNSFTQSVNVSSPSNLLFTGQQSNPNASGAPGWATTDNTPTGSVPSPSTTKPWGFYFLIAALGYFAVVKLK